MITALQNLPENTRFRLASSRDIAGTFLHCSGCSATVRLDGGTRDVEFEAPDGTQRSFRAQRSTTTTWAPATLVEPINDPCACNQPAPKQENDMNAATKKPKTKKPATASKQETKAAKPAPAKKDKPAAEAKTKKLSAIDAAAQVIAGSKEPMNSKQLIETMAAKGLWSSPGGKTPHATLYSAILREIGTKGKEARFKKADRGTFTSAT